MLVPSARTYARTWQPARGRWPGGCRLRPSGRLGGLLGGRDGRLLLVAVCALLGAPLATLAAVTATSALSLSLRVAFLRRPPAT